MSNCQTNPSDFHIRQYGRQELAIVYFPHLAPASAWRKLRGWLLYNPRLRHLVERPCGGPQSRTFTPREVALIVGELGEP